MKTAKCEQRKLELVGKAKPRKLDSIGFVEKRGRQRLLQGKGHVEIFFPAREERRTIYYEKRVFLAQFAEYLG